jgi:hypothetical protein
MMMESKILEKLDKIIKLLQEIKTKDECHCGKPHVTGNYNDTYY